MTKSKQSPLQRINRIMDFLWKRGNNKESVNEVYRKIINQKLNKNANTTTKTR
jgi:predicted transcriptional regulator